MDHMELAEAERADFAELLRGLDAPQWQAPSLCTGWSVRDVVAHMLSYEERGVLGGLWCFARGLGSFERTNEIAMADYAGDGPTELIARLERYRRPRGFLALMGGRVALVDGMIHQQDVRRPLGLPRVIPAERLVPTLEFAKDAPPLGAAARRKGLRLVATDVDWSAGDGAEVRGPGEALLMAVAGRREVLGELSGPGVAVLEERS